ncbi:hypothetical protein PG994_001294 [Apiospora phragmitis]|uniref:Uncharacterized protein n=1 Tax=Apiospora phragmitis TaxID=2905665 RepID=A0ABR1WT42_9PEZI
MNRTAAAARLRRTFSYPADEDIISPDDLLAQEALDEQEQEELIESLAAQNSRRNSQFRLFLLALPVLSTVPYLLSLVQPGRLNTLVAMLALTSLGSTAWMLHTLPPGETGIPALDLWVKGISGQQKEGGTVAARKSGAMLEVMQRKSPLEVYMPYLNAGLCGVLVLTGFVSKAHAPQQWGHVGLGNLPAVVYAVVLLAKMVMGSVDPETELGALKYDYKGA